MKIIVGVEQEPRVQFTIDVGDSAPDLMTLPDGSVIMLVGRYASPGDRYCYRRVRGQMTVPAVREWIEYSGLEG